MNPATSQTLFRACGINKSFPGVQALSAVDFELVAGQVHALVGENGAGKSTLTRIIAGLETADSGRMEFCERQYKPKGRADSEKLGIRMVMQELNLISNLTVAENIFIEKLPNRFGFIDYKKLNRDATEIMEKVGLGNIEPDVPVGELGIGHQQMVEIAAGLSRQCRILALDEPTASLTDREIELLFTQINKLKDEGVAVIYISHRIEEVLRISDRLTVLRDGKVVSTNPTSRLSVDNVINKMVGCDLEHKKLRVKSEIGEVVLRVVGLNFGRKVKDVSFELLRGEILGVAGLMGSGRTETMRLVFGADKLESGEIFLYGADRPVKIRTPSDAVRNGIAFLTEDRKEQGLLTGLSVRANISLTRLKDISRLGWMDTTEECSIADRYITALGIRCSSNEQIVGQLSGGNQQKVVIAKWIYRDCDILIFDEPTRGIDIGARFEIYRMLTELAEKGKAVILVSSDNKELMAVCDRIMVMSAGLVAKTFEPDEWSREKIMSAAFSRYVGTSEQ
ncbi:MAG: sugar ABC transporter ATP-binding protein [Sedimentisphaerales bacterium]|nr:sugar ABC transporter ATP-binding protein [Sedimentisphaerales bacterium]